MAFQPKNSQSPTVNATKSGGNSFPVDLVIWPRRQDDYLYKTHSGFFLQSGNQARHQGKTCVLFMVPLFHGFFWNLEKNSENPGKVGTLGTNPYPIPCGIFEFIIFSVSSRQVGYVLVPCRVVWWYCAVFFFEVVDLGRSFKNSQRVQLFYKGMWQEGWQE